MKTQNEEIIDYLNSGKVLTRAVAAGELLIFELSARIGEIERSGYAVDKTPRVYKSARSGRKVRLIEYRKG